MIFFAYKSLGIAYKTVTGYGIPSDNFSCDIIYIACHCCSWPYKWSDLLYPL